MYSLQTARGFRRQIKAIAEIKGWNPAWWAVVGAAGFGGQRPSKGGDLRGLGYRNANGGPWSDTFMARPCTPPATRAERIAWAVLAGRRSIHRIEELASSLPDQPLAATMRAKRGWVTPQPLADATKAVVFLSAAGALWANLADLGDRDLAAALASWTTSGQLLDHPRSSAAVAVGALRLLDFDEPAPTPAAVAIALNPVSLPAARHLHRQAWTAAGGPWLGLSWTDSLQVASTCHVAVDGFGHCLISDTVLTQPSPQQLAPLLAAIGEINTEQSTSRGTAKMWPAASWKQRTALVTARFDHPLSSFSHPAYAFGTVLATTFPRACSSRFGPTFQVPVAAGNGNDAQRRRQRVRHALLSVRQDSSGFEPLKSFASRLRERLTTEASPSGTLATLERAVLAFPFPAARRYWLATDRPPTGRVPPVTVLTGRGRLSSMRFPAETVPKPPLYAASAPPLAASNRDPSGSLTLTLIHHRAEVSISAFGTGELGETAPLQEFLDRWLNALRALASP